MFHDSAWMAWSIVTLFYAYQYILRIMPSVLMEDLVQKFSLSPDAFGQFSGLYYLAYSLMHIPVGIYLDRYGPKKVLPILLSMTAIGLLPLIFAESFIYPILGRVLIGVGSSGAILAVFKVLHMNFAPAKFSRYLSMSVTIGLLGAIYGGKPFFLLRATLGFETLIWGLVGAALVLAVLSYVSIADAPASTSTQQSWATLKGLFTHRPLLLLCGTAGLMLGPLEGFADVWGVQFLKIVHGIEEATAAGLPSWIFVGMCCGGPVLSFLAEKGQRHLEWTLVSAVVMASAFVALLTTTMSVTALSLLFFIVGVFSAYQILMIFHVSTLVPQEWKGLSSVVANMLIMTFGYVFHSLIGRSIGWFTPEGVVPYDTAQSLVSGIAIIPIALCISVVILASVLVRRSSSSRLA
jgi:predicted MFS family arabinose efflux permease